MNPSIYLFWVCLVQSFWWKKSCLRHFFGSFSLSILVEYHIQWPVQSVRYAPMSPDKVAQTGGISTMQGSSKDYHFFHAECCEGYKRYGGLYSTFRFLRSRIRTWNPPSPPVSTPSITTVIRGGALGRQSTPAAAPYSPYGIPNGWNLIRYHIKGIRLAM